jgi:plastocyanin
MRLLAVGTALAVLLAAPLRADAAGASIEVGHNRLSPAQVSIAPGDAVSFHNVDQMPGGHTVVADDGSFSSPPLAKDQTWSHTFEKGGSFGVHIKEHPGAKATIEVK